MIAKEKTMNKKSIIKYFIFIVVIIALTFLLKYAWARYITQIKGTADADIAKWSFKVNNKTNELFVIDLGQTRNSVEQQANVQDNYVGPGTAGRFDLEINASGSETSIEYEINMNVDNTNTNFPKNLIFYSDPEMKNAIYHENNVINLNGYIPYSDENKIRTNTIYWRWDYETGQTQDSINENDEADSIWMGRMVSLSINVVGRQVNMAPSSNQYSITFDANGGLLQGYGNAEITTKNLTYGEQYGNLPIPTREGYIFDGWISENLFDKNASTEPEIRNETPITHSGWPIVGKGFVYNMLKPNTQYTISYDMECIYVPDHTSNHSSSVGLYFDTSDHSQSIYYTMINEYLQIGDIRYIKKTFTTPNDLSDFRMYLTSNVYKNGDIYAVTTMRFKNINIYQEINPNTTVLIDKNHTLIAKWNKE